MTITKREYSAADAATAVLYIKQDGDDTVAYPVTAAMLNPGFAIPQYTKIILSYSGSTLTGVVYYNGTPSVATLTLAYTGSNLTLVTKA
jgi:hypothetical protein